MTKEITVQIWCDACLNDETNEPGSTVTLALDRHTARTLDLCERHLKEMIDPLITLIGKYGAPVEEEEPASTQRRKKLKTPTVETSQLSLDGEPPERESFLCLLCEQEFKNPTNLSGHFTMAHNATQTEVLGDTCPLCGHRSRSMAGIAVHMKSHDASFSSIGRFFKHAQDQGDPLGIIAERFRSAKQNRWIK